MRAQKRACLICRRIANSHHESIKGRRSISYNPYPKDPPQIRRPEPYILSDFVIELDAADSTFVRRFEDMTPEEQRLQLRQKPDSWEIQTIQPSRTRPDNLSTARRATIANSHNEFTPLYVLRPEPTDLLAEAFARPISDRGNSADRTHSIGLRRSKTLGELHKGRMTPLGASSRETFIRLSTGFTTDADNRLQSAGFDTRNAAEIAGDLSKTRDFSVLERIVARLSSTNRGCALLAQHGRNVNQAIQTCLSALHEERRTGQKTGILTKNAGSTFSRLQMLNNLSISAESKGIPIDVDLCLSGLYYAAKSNNLPAVRRYLQIFSRQFSDLNSGEAIKALKALQINYVKENPFPSGWLPLESEEFKRKEIATLITGWPLGVEPSHDGRKRQLSFAMFAPKKNFLDNKYKMYYHYICGLGEMQLVRAVWSEWQSYIESNPQELFLGCHVFAMALILAKDFHHARLVWEALPDHTPRPARAEQARLFRSLLYGHYKFHNLVPCGELDDIIHEHRITLAHPDDKGQHPFTLLQSVLCIDFPKYVPRTPLNLKFGEMYGEHGLLVMPERGDNPIYFRPI
ncbi:hypothetical protein B0J14DRAFT_566608 [Halenospora varia]|nr:hypothetical protein B0J14DRAFT_566608 [Halenospora varia]